MASNDRAYSPATGPIAAVAVISVDAFARSTNPSRGEKRLAGPVELTAPPSFGRRFGCVARYRSARRKRWRNSGLARHTSPRALTPFAYGRLELVRKDKIMTIQTKNNNTNQELSTQSQQFNTPPTSVTIRIRVFQMSVGVIAAGANDAKISG